MNIYEHSRKTNYKIFILLRKVNVNKLFEVNIFVEYL